MSVNLVSLLRTWVLGNETNGDCRRKFKRHARVTYIEIQPLDQELSPVGERAWGMTRDLSVQGVGFTTESSFQCEHVRVFIRDDDYSAIAAIRHQRLISAPDETPKFLIGVEFLDDYNCHYLS